MTKVRIETINEEVTIRNKREQQLVNICTHSIERLVNDVKNSEQWKKSFNKGGMDFWRIREIDGLLTAMFYMDMIPEPVSVLDLFDAISKAVA